MALQALDVRKWFILLRKFSANIGDRVFWNGHFPGGGVGEGPGAGVGAAVWEAPVDQAFVALIPELESVFRIISIGLSEAFWAPLAWKAARI